MFRSKREQKQRAECMTVRAMLRFICSSHTIRNDIYSLLESWNNTIISVAGKE